jgi:hypothetical protein
MLMMIPPKSIRNKFARLLRPPSADITRHSADIASTVQNPNGPKMVLYDLLFTSLSHYLRKLGLTHPLLINGPL